MIAEILFLVAVFLAAGAAAGLLAGLLGVGGGIVVVPVLYHVVPRFAADQGPHMHVAVGTSLAVIVLTAAISARRHHRRGAVDGALLKGWAPAVVAGVAAGAAVAGYVATPVLNGVFAGVAAAVAVRLAVWPDIAPVRSRLPAPPWQWGFPLGIGAVSSLMGIGGGTLTVPVLTACGYPMTRAVGTAAAVGVVIAVPGAVGFAVAGWGVPGRPPFSIGYVNLPGVVCLAPATMLAAPWGVRFAHHLPGRVLRWVFAAFLAVVAVRMAVAALL